MRVVNLGLMDVDSTLHRFSPRLPCGGDAALRGLVRMLSTLRPGADLPRRAAQGSARARSAPAAAGCGLLPEGEECRAAAAPVRRRGGGADPPDLEAPGRLVKFTIPNLLSLLRMGLVPLFIIAVLDGESRRALLIFASPG